MRLFHASIQLLLTLCVALRAGPAPAADATVKPPFATAPAIAADTLSWKPSRLCKKTPQAPPRKLLHENYDSEGAPTNYPFITNVDINGDGWCDWVGTGAFYYPVRSQYDPIASDRVMPPLKDFIFLGTKTGWRPFGNMEALKKSFIRMGSEDSAPEILTPVTYAAYFVDPIFVYAHGNSKPFIIALGGPGLAFLAPFMENVTVYRWDDRFDTLNTTGPQEREKILAFIRKTSCSPNKDYQNDDGHSTISTICCGAEGGSGIEEGDLPRSRECKKPKVP